MVTLDAWKRPSLRILTAKCCCEIFCLNNKMGHLIVFKMIGAYCRQPQKISEKPKVSNVLLSAHLVLNKAQSMLAPDFYFAGCLSILVCPFLLCLFVSAPRCPLRHNTQRKHHHTASKYVVLPKNTTQPIKHSGDMCRSRNRLNALAAFPNLSSVMVCIIFWAFLYDHEYYMNHMVIFLFTLIAHGGIASLVRLSS